MLAWANREAVERTLATGRAWFWSRSRGELWEKGATSGNVLAVVDVAPTATATRCCCRSSPHGPACHTGSETCWGERRSFPAALARTIEARRDADPATSYVARLLNGPREHAARKVGEEATEVLLAEPGSDEQVGEVADLVFHALVLLARDGRDPLDALAELARQPPRGRRSFLQRHAVFTRSPVYGPPVSSMSFTRARRAQVAAPGPLLVADRAQLPDAERRMVPGRQRPGPNAGSCSPALAQTVSQSSFSLRHVETSRK